jgi:c(7)-type cytochrome triheme protein
MQSLRLVLLLSPLLFFVACSDDTLNFFFDIPPATEAEKAEAAREKAAAEAAKRTEARAAAGAAPTEVELERPAIESTLVYEQALEMLPLDDFDEPDYMAALRQGVIRPRGATNGADHADSATFKFDFILEGPDPSMNALFPHSAHTQWLTCESCHPKIFPVRGTQISMDEIFEGQYCGVCHGVVAFAVDDCTRCHFAMEE